MKKYWIFLPVLLLAAKPLGLLPQSRGLEEWKLVTALALDQAEARVTATALTGVRVTEDEEPEVFTGEGPSLAQACAALRESSARRTYLGQTQQLLLGEGTDVSAVLDFILTQRELRTDTLLYIVKGNAGEALGASSDQTGSETGGQDPRGRTVGEVLPRLSEGGCAAVPLLAPGEEGALTPAGWAVLGPGGVLGYLEGDAALGADLLAGKGRDRTVTLPGGAAALASVRLKVREGTLSCTLTARTVQGSPREEDLAAWGERMLRAALAPGWDCWGLGRRQAALSPEAWTGWREPEEGTLPLHIQTEGRLVNGGERQN